MPRHQLFFSLDSMEEKTSFPNRDRMGKKGGEENDQFS